MKKPMKPMGPAAKLGPTMPPPGMAQAKPAMKKPIAKKPAMMLKAKKK